MSESEETHEKEVATISANAGAIANIMDTLDAAFERNEPVINLSAEYLALDDGESKKLVYLQTTQREELDEETGELATKETALFCDENKNTYVSMNLVVLNATKALNGGETVVITGKGAKDLGKGKKLGLFDVVLCK